MPAIFGDHMVLQEDGKIPVWGSAASGEPVTVSLATISMRTQADAKGQWRINLPPIPRTAAALTMTVTGKNTLTFQDVLVGDVWLGSGQSNMGLTLDDMKGGPGVDEAVATAANPRLRLFVVQNQLGIVPLRTLTGSWQVASPEAAARFSAVTFFFGRELQRTLNRPIGLIVSSWGGTFIRSWMSFESLKSLPFTGDSLAAVERRRNAFPQDSKAQNALLADYQLRVKDWQANVDTPFQAAMQKWQTDDSRAKAAGQPEPIRPVESSSVPISPSGEVYENTVLFNGMVNPLIPYGIKGVIWYQGENDARTNADVGEPYYQSLLTTMITDWRVRWTEGNFPFLIVGLANYDYRYPMPTDSGWPALIAAQENVAETVPNTALAEAIDLGEAHNIHPKDKLDLSKRLVAAALHVAYGRNEPFAGPSFESMEIEGSRARVRFKNVGSGLVVGISPRVFDDNAPISKTDVVGFSIAGNDKKWAFAEAKIEGSEVVVSSGQVQTPVAVRYGWSKNPAVNLYNKDGFPAVPFRTDDWPYVAPPQTP